jgi:lipopolysaccharide/colanic/teichoic acid biosynthesis glycosyltransferase
MSASSTEAGSLSTTRLAVIDGESRYTAAACRALDVAVSAVLLVVLSPVFLILTIAIRLDSSGRALYRQRRVGRNQKPFTVNKFRTMHSGAGHDAHREFVIGLIAREQGKSETQEQEQAQAGGGDSNFFKMTNDTRVTRVGRFLRKSSLDELPQLWNVLRGDMSLVGPRPPIPYEVEHYPPHWFDRFAVKPGMTGLWQVSGRSELALEDMIALDVEYARSRSLWLNLKVLARTVPAVFAGRGAA